MMSVFNLKISSNEGILFDDSVSMLTLRGTEGDLAIMAGHIPFITAVKPGLCKIIFENGDEKNCQLQSGILTVSKEGTTLLCNGLNWK